MSRRLTIDDFRVGSHLVCQLPFFLRQALRLEEARSELQNRLTSRRENFLDLARRTIYGNPSSPYGWLLRQAGCEYGDLANLVMRDGLEETLRVLYRRGIYLTMREMKGRCAVLRGSAALHLDPRTLRNPYVTAHIANYSSGVTGSRTFVPIDLAAVRDRAVDTGVVLAARGDGNWQHALWEVPGGSFLHHLLEYSSLGKPIVRWFSQIDPGDPRLHPRYRWAARIVRSVGRLVGVSLPRAQYVPVDNPLPILHWLMEIVRTGQTPHLKTYASSGVRLAKAAKAAGVSLEGVHLTLSGEPTTAARLATIKASGASALPQFGATEASLVGYGCLAPKAPDDLHLSSDRLAVIQSTTSNDEGNQSPTTLLLTSLRPTAGLILLNAGLGDQANLTETSCGCPLEQLGWNLHLSSIRSFEKLTVSGMSFVDQDITRLLDNTLPSMFGGHPTDYQIVETEAPDGSPILKLLVNPSVGPLDVDAVREEFLSLLGTGAGIEKITSLLWRQGFLEVERRAPFVTASGKILHRHMTGC